MLNRTPRCSVCKTPLQGPKLVIGGYWYCPDCAYELEYGPAKRVEKVPRARRPQAEDLFDERTAS